MKRVLIFILVAALLGGIVYTGLSLRPEVAEAQPPGPQRPGDYELVTLLEDVTLNPGEAISSDWLDIKPYKWFKIYAYATTTGEYFTPWTVATVYDAPFSAAGPCTAMYALSWNPTPTPGQFSQSFEFKGLYSEISVYAHNNPPPEIESTETISVYILLARE